MNRTANQNARFHALVNSLGLDADEKKELIRQVSGGRVGSSRDLAAKEMDAAIRMLSGQDSARVDRMRRKARAIATEMGVVVGNDYSRLDKWIAEKWKRPSLFQLSVKQLGECITALERWRDGRRKALLNGK